MFYVQFICHFICSVAPKFNKQHVLNASFYCLSSFRSGNAPVPGPNEKFTKGEMWPKSATTHTLSRVDSSLFNLRLIFFNSAHVLSTKYPDDEQQIKYEARCLANETVLCLADSCGSMNFRCQL